MKLRISRSHYERLKRCAGWVHQPIGEYARLRWKHREAESAKNASEDAVAVEAMLAESPRGLVMTVPDCDAPADELIRVLVETIVRVERIMRLRGWREDAPPPPVDGVDYYMAGNTYPGIGRV